MSKIDIFLSIVQRMVLITGAGIAAWIFIFREEGGQPHIETSIAGEIFSDCTAVISLSIENVGGRVWTISSATVSLMEPDLGNPAQSTEERRVDFAADGEPRQLRIGEGTTYVFSMRIEEPSDVTFYEVGYLVTEEEEEVDGWVRTSQDYIENRSCFS